MALKQCIVWFAVGVFFMMKTSAQNQPRHTFYVVGAADYLYNSVLPKQSGDISTIDFIREGYTPVRIVNPIVYHGGLGYRAALGKRRRWWVGAEGSFGKQLFKTEINFELNRFSSQFTDEVFTASRSRQRFYVGIAPQVGWNWPIAQKWTLSFFGGLQAMVIVKNDPNIVDYFFLQSTRLALNDMNYYAEKYRVWGLNALRWQLGSDAIFKLPVGRIGAGFLAQGYCWPVIPVDYVSSFFYNSNGEQIGYQNKGTKSFSFSARLMFFF